MIFTLIQLKFIVNERRHLILTVKCNMPLLTIHSIIRWFNEPSENDPGVPPQVTGYVSILCHFVYW